MLRLRRRAEALRGDGEEEFNFRKEPPRRDAARFAEPSATMSDAAAAAPAPAPAPAPAEAASSSAPAPVRRRASNCARPPRARDAATAALSHLHECILARRRAIF